MTLKGSHPLFSFILLMVNEQFTADDLRKINEEYKILQKNVDQQLLEKEISNLTVERNHYKAASSLRNVAEESCKEKDKLIKEKDSYINDLEQEIKC